MSQIAVGSGQYSDGERLQSFDAAAPAGRFNLFRARRPVLFAYSVPLITVGSALVITLISFYFVGYRPNPVIALAYPLAVLAAAWWGGYGPGILSVALCFAVVPYLLLPNFSITKVDPTRVALTLLVSLLVSRVAAGRRKIEDTLRQGARELEQAVKERTADLLLSESKYRKLFAESPQPMWVFDPEDLRFLMVNQAAVQLYGYSVDEFLRMTVKDVSTSEALEPETEFPGLRLMKGMVWRSWKKDGTLIWVEAVHSGIEVDGRLAELVLLTDVTERKRLEDELGQERDRYQALARHLSEIQEQEKQHLSREIHDALGQELTALKYRLQQAGLRSPEEVSSLSASIDKLITKMRDIAAHLRPPVLDHLSLPDAIEWLSHEFRGGTDISCTLRMQQDIPDVAPAVKLAAFRVCQEALTNIQRHAAPSQVTIRMSYSDGRLKLRIEDDGRGFDPQSGRTGSLGLLGMRERAVAIGGRLVVESAAGCGTRVLLEAPLEGGGDARRADA